MAQAMHIQIQRQVVNFQNQLETICRSRQRLWEHHGTNARPADRCCDLSSRKSQRCSRQYRSWQGFSGSSGQPYSRSLLRGHTKPWGTVRYRPESAPCRTGLSRCTSYLLAAVTMLPRETSSTSTPASLAQLQKVMVSSTVRPASPKPSS